MYIFYDTETTGLDALFAQILQAAFILTDDDMNPLASHKVESRRAAWVVPSPAALLVTGIMPEALKRKKTSQYEMMRDIYRWVEGQHWPLLFVGYNSKRFDRTVISANLSSALMPADMMTAASPHGRGRNRELDVFPLVKWISQYYPKSLTLKTGNGYGGPSLSLLNVCRQNGIPLSEDEAHDAFDDSRATAGLARLIRDRFPDLWAHALAVMTSEADTSAFMQANPVFAYTDFMYGRNRTAAVTDLGMVAADGRRLVFDLAHVPDGYLRMTPEELAREIRRVFMRDEKGGVPFYLVRLEEQPVVAPAEMGAHVIDGYDASLARRRATRLAGQPAFAENLRKALDMVVRPRRDFSAAARAPVLEELFFEDVPASVLQKLSQWIDAFHHAPDWAARAEMARSFGADFADDIGSSPSLKRFGKIAGRIVFDNAPDALTPAEQKAMKVYLARRALAQEKDVPWNTLAKARNELADIEAEREKPGSRWADVTDSQIRSLKLYYTALEKEMSEYLGVVPPAPPVAPKGPKPPGA